jgi:hypothetical protein
VPSSFILSAATDTGVGIEQFGESLFGSSIRERSASSGID